MVTWERMAYKVAVRRQEVSCRRRPDHRFFKQKELGLSNGAIRGSGGGRNGSDAQDKNAMENRDGSLMGDVEEAWPQKNRPIHEHPERV